jgi:hypothetical protein
MLLDEFFLPKDAFLAIILNAELFSTFNSSMAQLSKIAYIKVE